MSGKSFKVVKTKETNVAFIHRVVKNRKEMKEVIGGLKKDVTADHIQGPAFAIFWYVTSITDGYEVDIGFPVDPDFRTDGIETKVLPGMDAISWLHKGSLDLLGEGIGELYQYADQHAIISDEFRQEIYHDNDDPIGNLIEVRFIVHNWTGLLQENVSRVVGSSACTKVMHGCEALKMDSSLSDRVEWTKTAMEAMADHTNEDQRYEILSSCAHVFPKSQLDKLTEIYQSSRAKGMDGLGAVDSVIDFMAEDPGWGENPRREGRIIFAKKNPRNRAGYESAESDLQRRSAYCFCPLIRRTLDNGMPRFFCYCGSGWYRQQWEAAIGKKVNKIDIVRSVLQGDDECEFAIYLPDDL